MNRKSLVVAICLGAAHPSAAQISTVPRPEASATFLYTSGAAGPGCKTFPASPVKPLDDAIHAGDGELARAEGLKLLECLAADPDLKAHLGNLDDDYYHLIWEGKDDDGKQTVFRLLVHRGLQASQANRLPGLTDSSRSKLIDVLLSDDETSKLVSLYVATPKANPTTAALPDVVGALGLPGLIGSITPLHQEMFLKAFKGPLPVAAPTATPEPLRRLFATVFRVDLPLARADLKIRDMVRTPANVSEFKDALDDLQERLLAREARDSVCAQELTATLVVALKGQADRCDTVGTCSKAMADRVESETTKSMSSSSCKGKTGPAVGYDPPLEVEKQFSALGRELAASVSKGTVDERNEPLTSISFGIASGLIVGRPTLDTPRVTLDAGKIVRDPLPRTLTMMVVNFHPKPYDAELPRMSKAERFRAFGGFVLTPSPGLTTGLSAQIVRGLSINAGWAWMFVNTTKGSDKLDAAPSDEQDPFKRRTSRVFFAALGYAFKP